MGSATPTAEGSSQSIGGGFDGTTMTKGDRKCDRRPEWAAMPFWKPHALANPHTDQLDLRMGDKVRTLDDLHGVPAGTVGKVILANGFQWQRYRVQFENGAELGDLDSRQIEPIGRAAKRLAKAAAKAAR